MSNRIKGLPRSVVQNGDRLEIWVESPTGDSSDSQILEIQDSILNRRKVLRPKKKTTQL
jgi:hypothetical protein